LSGVCGVSWHPKILSRHVIESIVMSSSVSSGMCWHWWSSLSLVGLFPFFFSLFSLKNYNLALFVVRILTSVLILFISSLCSWSICRSFNYFQFNLSISIYQILYFSIWSLFFWFLTLILVVLISNFFLDFFVKVIILFKFTLQSKICLYFYVNFDPHSFDFLGPFAKLIFLFNFTFQSHINFILYFNFDFHSFNCYFFFCIIEIRFSISSFNIWLIENWTSWFF